MADLHYEALDFRADALEQRADGFLRGLLTLALPGVYRVNTWDGQSFTEYVPPETLADSEYVSSLAGLPVTLDHPSPVPEVTPDNAQEVGVGAMREARVRSGDGALEAPVTVWTRRAITAARTSHRQSSLGYHPVYDDTPGIAPNGQAYDRKQVKRVANHVALVPQGVHGSRAMFRADSAGPRFNIRADDAALDSEAGAGAISDKLTNRSETPHEVPKMAQVRLGNLTVDVPDAATASAIQTHVDSQTQALATAQTHAVRADRAEADRDQAKADATRIQAEADAKLAQVRADAAGSVRSRIALELQVQGVMGKDFKAEGKSDRQLRADALGKLGIEVPADKSDDYVAARFDGAIETRSDGKVVTPVAGRSAAQLLADQMNVRGDGEKTGAEPEHYDANAALGARWN